jgi:hypothetical protein
VIQLVLMFLAENLLVEVQQVELMLKVLDKGLELRSSQIHKVGFENWPKTKKLQTI